MKQQPSRFLGPWMYAKAGAFAFAFGAILDQLERQTELLERLFSR